MRRIYGQELKKVQLEILDVVADFCEKNNISYFLNAGTLLGSIRHKGYIPWDDDIDLGMMRPDYDRFMALFNQSNMRYKFYSIENNPDFYYPFGKVLDTDTVLYEPDKDGTKLAINIDIFVYDNVPDNDKTLLKMYKRRDNLRYLHTLRTANHQPHGNIVRRFCVRCMRKLLSIFPENYFVKKMMDNSKKYNKQDLETIGDFTGYSRLICGKSILCDVIDGEFENKTYKIPAGYDLWLKMVYGDYMQLPPEEERCSHHTFEAYVK